MIQEAIDALGTASFWLDAAIVTAIVRFVWTVVQRLSDALLFRLSLRTKVIEVSFEARPDVPPEIEALKYLFIRYGNDTYLRELASDQEKHHGKLQNRVYAVTVDPPLNGVRRIRVKLRVHKRLGTQFKFFVDVKGETGPVISYLESHDNIYKVEASPRPGDKKRVFFLVKDYPEIETVDGFRNNMIFPV
ncbi:hypothetical protein [Roseovarius aestuariivivens]|uniref:hypothetical protein n=1 Tax=Roseovarius aestuariivivens TaxID=1888910 RepID=UPI001081C13D|nr:hypothetical protein [Roseovarius aestuariivivens]